MDWQEYELEIGEQIRAAYPSAQITRDAKLVGKFSKVERQIDLLIEEHASDFAFRIVVDAKYRGRKIDVGDVEAFIGLTRDVEAHTGMMVALEGYTPAAVNRAHNDDLDMILDVLNFEELKAFQGFAAIPIPETAEFQLRRRSDGLSTRPDVQAWSPRSMSEASALRMR
jgi:restriction endonuclease